MDERKLVDNGSTFSGGLEETYVDFEAWIARWRCKYKPRLHPRKQHPMETVDDVKKVIPLQDLLIYGFITSHAALAPREVVFRLEFNQTHDFAQLDSVLLKLLNRNYNCKENAVKSKM